MLGLGLDMCGLVNITALHYPVKYSVFKNHYVQRLFEASCHVRQRLNQLFKMPSAYSDVSIISCVAIIQQSVSECWN